MLSYLFVVLIVIFLLYLLINNVVLPIRASIRKSRLEEERRREASAKKRAADAEERQRKEILRERDPQVDGIMAKVVSTRLVLDRVLAGVHGEALESEDVAALQKWMDTHESVMDFCVFQTMCELINNSLSSNEPLLKEDLLNMLDDEGTYEDLCLDYADEKLGINREIMLIDGETEGGTAYKKATGGYEYIHKRYQRVLLSLPGADRGHVYILTNDSMPGLIKIGSTRKDPAKRAANLSRHTGVPSSFKVAYSIIVGNCRLTERMVHERLSSHRLRGGTEFFRISVSDAIAVIEEISQEIERRGAFE